MRPGVAVFHAPQQIYEADTCEPLRAAAARGEVRLIACSHGAYPGRPLPPRTLPEVRTVGLWDADYPQQWGLDWHRNEGIELAYLSRGRLHYAVEDACYVLKHGKLTITRPWQIHRIGDPLVGASRLHWLILDVGVRRPNQQWHWPRWLASSEADLAFLTSTLSHSERSVWDTDAPIEHYFEQLSTAVATYDDDGAGESHLKLYISGLLVALTDLLRRCQPALDTSLSSTQRTVDRFLASLPRTLDRSWDIPLMAAACGLGRSRFTYYCEKLTNMSPGDYLTHCRIAAAARLLVDPHCPDITEIALCCGFSSSQYFATVFRNQFGCSPRDYRAAGMATPSPGQPELG